MAHVVPGAGLATHTVLLDKKGGGGGGGGWVGGGVWGSGRAAWGGLIMWRDGLRGALCVGCLAAVWMFL